MDLLKDIQIADLVGKEDLELKLKKKKKLTIKLGCDPSSADLHLGHFIPIRNLRRFQDMGHEVIFIIGDFTASIGDPTGKNEMRKPLTREEIEVNAKTYTDQVFMVLDRSKTRVVYNSEWLNKLTPTDFVKLLSKYTVARMLERDDFEKRYKSGAPIGIHEFLYPLMQGYDSVELENDIEIGGTDQRFNLLVGRDLQRDYGKEAQACIMFPLLEGLDGKNKMSKSLGNTINFKDDPKDIFGKVMSISDELMWRYYDIVLGTNSSEIEKMKSMHPKERKQNLGMEIVKLFHPVEKALQAKQEFDAVFAKGDLPEDIEEFSVTKAQFGTMNLLTLLVEAKVMPSKGEAKRMLAQNAISIDGAKVTTEALPVDAKEFVLKVGKRKFLKVKII